MDAGEEEGVQGGALGRVGRVDAVAGPHGVEAAGDAAGPEPQAVDADGEADHHADVGAEAAEEADGARAVVGVEAGAVAQSVRDAEDGAAAEVHEHEAVDLAERARHAVVGHGDEKVRMKMVLVSSAMPISDASAVLAM